MASKKNERKRNEIGLQKGTSYMWALEGNEVKWQRQNNNAEASEFPLCKDMPDRIVNLGSSSIMSAMSKDESSCVWVHILCPPISHQEDSKPRSLVSVVEARTLPPWPPRIHHPHPHPPPLERSCSDCFPQLHKLDPM